MQVWNLDITRFYNFFLPDLLNISVSLNFYSHRNFNITTSFRSILLKELVQPILPMLDQIIEGLNLYNILQIMRENSHLFQYVFCENKCLAWTFEKFEEFAIPKYSEEGSSKRSMEINTFKTFMDFMESSFYEG